MLGSTLDRVWRRRITGAAVLLAMSPGLAYFAIVGWTVPYDNWRERGVVTARGVVHEPWSQASSSDLECRLNRARLPTRALITFTVAFPNGDGDDFSFSVGKDDFGNMLDWDLWVSYVLRKTYWVHPHDHARPNIVDNPDCDWFVDRLAPPAFAVKFKQLFAPVASPAK